MSSTATSEAHQIRVRDDALGYYASHRGVVIATFETRQEAEDIVRAAPNGAEWEVVPA